MNWLITWTSVQLSLHNHFISKGTPEAFNGMLQLISMYKNIPMCMWELTIRSSDWALPIFNMGIVQCSCVNLSPKTWLMNVIFRRQSNELSVPCKWLLYLSHNPHAGMTLIPIVVIPYSCSCAYLGVCFTNKAPGLPKVSPEAGRQGQYISQASAHGASLPTRLSHPSWAPHLRLCGEGSEGQ